MSEVSNLIYHLKEQLSVARSEIKNLRQQISALKYEHQKDIKSVKDIINNVNSHKIGDQVKPDLCQKDSTASTSKISYQPIGYIETTFQNKRAIPRQTTLVSGATGLIHLNCDTFNNPEHALSGLQEFSHFWVIFHFHSNASNSVPAKVTPPRCGGMKCGVFATRSPHRPCPIGMSLVKLKKIDGNKIYFNGVDMMNNTPVLDIKPYIPMYDDPSSFKGDQAIRPSTEGGCDEKSDNSMKILANDSPTNHYQPSNPSANCAVPVCSGSQSSTENNESACERNIARGVPDGEEISTTPIQMQNIDRTQIKVPSWISDASEKRYDVKFTNDVLIRLDELIGDRAEGFKNNVKCILSEDPRSLYVRNRYSDHEYCCVLEDLCLSCVFDSKSSTCTIVSVKNAEELQDI